MMKPTTRRLLSITNYRLIAEIQGDLAEAERLEYLITVFRTKRNRLFQLNLGDIWNGLSGLSDSERAHQKFVWKNQINDDKNDTLSCIPTQSFIEKDTNHEKHVVSLRRAYGLELSQALCRKGVERVKLSNRIGKLWQRVG